MSKTQRIQTIISLTAGVLLLAGCDSDPFAHTQMKSDTEVRETRTIEHTQMEAGARDDATLYPPHFDGPLLSSLGTNKLDLMLRDSHRRDPFVVYIAGPKELAHDRAMAVNTYLLRRGGLKQDQIKLQEGPNPDSYSPAGIGLRNYDKTDTAGDENGSATPGNGTAGSH